MNNLQKTIDAAVILSIVTGGLFVVGWVHWWTYFKYFGIRSFQIDLSLHEVIVTTWWILLPLIISFILIGYLTNVKEIDESKRFDRLLIGAMNKLMRKFRTVIFTFLLLLVGAILVVICGSEGLSLILSISVFITSMIIISFYLVGELLNRDYNSKNILVLLVLASFCNIYTGFVAADRVSNGTDGLKISIQHENEKLSVDKYIFISYMNGVYYIQKPKSDRFNFQTIMMHESNIEQVNLSK